MITKKELTQIIMKINCNSTCKDYICPDCGSVFFNLTKVNLAVKQIWDKIKVYDYQKQYVLFYGNNGYCKNEYEYCVCYDKPKTEKEIQQIFNKMCETQQIANDFCCIVGADYNSFKVITKEQYESYLKTTPKEKRDAFERLHNLVI